MKPPPSPKMQVLKAQMEALQAQMQAMPDSVEDIDNEDTDVLEVEDSNERRFASPEPAVPDFAPKKWQPSERHQPSPPSYTNLEYTERHQPSPPSYTNLENTERHQPSSPSYTNLDNTERHQLRDRPVRATKESPPSCTNLENIERHQLRAAPVRVPKESPPSCTATENTERRQLRGFPKRPSPKLRRARPTSLGEKVIPKRPVLPPRPRLGRNLTQEHLDMKEELDEEREHERRLEPTSPLSTEESVSKLELELRRNTEMDMVAEPELKSLAQEKEAARQYDTQIIFLKQQIMDLKRRVHAIKERRDQHKRNISIVT